MYDVPVVASSFLMRHHLGLHYQTSLLLFPFSLHFILSQMSSRQSKHETFIAFRENYSRITNRFLGFFND